MINRANWKLVKAYLAYRAEVSQITEESLRMDECRLRHLLEWADSKPFKNVLKMRPTLPDYLQTARIDGRGDELSYAYTKKIINAAHQFGQWLITHETGYKKDMVRWLDTLKAPRGNQSEDRQHEAVSLDYIHALSTAPVSQLWEKRIRAAAVFLYLSGMRVGAFVSLPILAIDLNTQSVKQWPKLGVKTKNRKHETTHLLPLPELMPVVQEWDALVRAVLPGSGYWFAPLDSLTGEIAPEINKIGHNRDMRVRTDLKRWLDSVGLPYMSPHKYRHGHAVYGLTHATDMADFKAVSMNLMHSNMSITDGIYSILSQQEKANRISNLGKNNGSNTDIAAVLRQLANEIEQNKN